MLICAMHVQNNFDPRYGMSKEEFEWRCAQQKRVCQRMPQALDKLKICSEKMRNHFLDDPDALEEWEDYENDVYDSFENNLQHSLSSPLNLPVSLMISFATFCLLESQFH